MELSDGQFEQLVGMLAESRAAIAGLASDVKVGLEGVELRLMKEITAVAKNHQFTMSLLQALEEDVGGLQSAVRRIGETQRTTIASYDQALDGLTQLCRSTFDMTESIQKHIHEESSRSGHDEGTQESRSQRPQ